MMVSRLHRAGIQPLVGEALTLGFCYAVTEHSASKIFVILPIKNLFCFRFTIFQCTLVWISDPSGHAKKGLGIIYGLANTWKCFAGTCLNFDFVLRCNWWYYSMFDRILTSLGPQHRCNTPTAAEHSRHFRAELLPDTSSRGQKGFGSRLSSLVPRLLFAGGPGAKNTVWERDYRLSGPYHCS